MRVFVRLQDPARELTKIESKVQQIVEVHSAGAVVEVTESQLQVLKNLGLKVLEEMNE